MSWTPQRPQVWHEMLADLLILNPNLTNAELGEALSLHEQIIAQVRRSDMFGLVMDRRRASIDGNIEDEYMARITGKTAKLAELAVDTVTEQLERERKLLHASVQKGSLETCEMALKSLGFIGGKGPSASSPTPASIHIERAVIVDNAVLTDARDTWRQLHAQRASSNDSRQVADPAYLPAPAKVS